VVASYPEGIFEWLLFDYNNFSLLIDPALWVDYCDALRYDPIMTHCVRNVKPFFIRISLERKIHFLFTTATWKKMTHRGNPERIFAKRRTLFYSSLTSN